MTKREALLYALYLVLILAMNAAADEVVGKRLYNLNTKDSAGVVVGRTYRRCFWPKSDAPIRPFAPGSRQIKVEGPPTPRNIVFPADTVFLNGTNGAVFSTSTVRNQDVEEIREVQISALVDGEIRDVTYLKPVLVNRPVKQLHPVDEATARAIADAQAASSQALGKGPAQ